MPTPGQEQLSSRLTSPLQVAPMLAWLGDAYVLIWLVLHRHPDLHGFGANGMMPMFERLVLFLLAVPLLLLPAISFWAAGLRKVVATGTDLLVTLGSGKVATVPLTAVADVAEGQSSDLRVVRVTLEGKTAAGTRVRFLAPTRFRVPRGEPHPVVVALRDMVKAARSEGEVKRFGQRVIGA